jgi:hypothetical protein
MIPVGQWYMSTRPRFEMRTSLTMWNVFLALFSIMGAARTLPEFIHVIRTSGIYYSVCIPRYVLFIMSLTFLLICVYIYTFPSTLHTAPFKIDLSL